MQDKMCVGSHVHRVGQCDTVIREVNSWLVVEDSESEACYQTGGGNRATKTTQHVGHSDQC